MGISDDSERLPYYESLVSDSTNKFRMWYRIINAIGRRKLTEQADLLPALSGLAQQFQRHGAGTYLAGIWENDLPQGLLWSVHEHSRDKTTRADPYRAPSWSWASIGNGIGEYDEHLGYTDFGACLERVYAKVLEARCIPDGKDPLGAVAKDQCYLKVYGPLMELAYHGSESGGAPRYTCRVERPCQKKPPPTAICYDLDFEVDLDRERSLYCLYIGDLNTGWPSRKCQGLILRQYRRSPHPGFEEAFERVGSFGHEPGTVEKLAEYIEMREVVIF